MSTPETSPETTGKGGMRLEAKLLLGVAIFFGVTVMLYMLPIWGHSDKQQTSPDRGGIMMLIGTILLGFVPGSYYLWWSYKMKPRPEDRDDATMEDGAGVVGSFPSSSIWPFIFGMGCLFVALAAVFGFWLLAIALSLIFAAVCGYTAESRRGGNV